MANRRFTDNAGYTRHCWECAFGIFQKGETVGARFITNRAVSKNDSPNNELSSAGGCWDYREKGKKE